MNGGRDDDAALRESREAFARVFEDAPIGMSLTAGVLDETRFVRVNPAFCDIFGATSEQILAVAPQDLVHPEDLLLSRGPWRRMLGGWERHFSIEQRMLRFDGSVFWALSHASLVRDADGRPLYAVTQLQDVTARRTSEQGLRAAERRFRTAFDAAGTAMLLVGLDGRLMRVNRAFSELLGRPEDELLGADARELVHPDEIDPAEAHVEALVAGDAGPEDSYSRDVRWLRADGRTVWTRITAVLVRDDDGRPQYLVEQIVDMTAEREARELAERRIAQQSAVAWLGQRALSDPDLGSLLCDAVDVVASTLGASHASLCAAGPAGLRLVAGVGWPAGTVRPLDAARSHTGYTLSEGRPVVVADARDEDRFSTASLQEAGVRSGTSVVVAGEGSEPYGVLGAHAPAPHAFSTDDTAFLTSVANVLTGAIRRDAGARDLRHQSLHDPLTALPNRALLLDRLRQGLARARRDGSTLGVLFCDMDDFKVVNDSLGHDAGDRLLTTLAGRLQEALRGTDTLARFGGDEFIVLCEGLHDASEVLAVAERVQEACARPVLLGGREFVPSASIGIAIAPPGTHVEPEALLRDADVAMYGAKARGKGRCELFDARMRARTLDRIGLLSDLRHAVERDELELVFQPIVSLRRTRVIGVESLVRWRHPQRGLLLPGQFLGVAEESGLIHELGGWVLRAAVRQAAAWRRARTPGLDDVMVGFNASWRQVAEPALVDEVVAALESEGLPAGAFCLEVTESGLLEDRDRALDTLRRLRELGVRLSLDDFGTGQSSLSVLRDFPLHSLKLDRTFIAGDGDWPIVEAVCRMARSMELRVIAEGIEATHQADRASRLGCDFGQGWLYCRPLPAGELEAAIRRLPGAPLPGDAARVA